LDVGFDDLALKTESSSFAEVGKIVLCGAFAVAATVLLQSTLGEGLSQDFLLLRV
jgi:hypothetical protein